MVMDRFFIMLLSCAVLLPFGNVRFLPLKRPNNFKVITKQELINHLQPLKSETDINEY